MRSRKWLIAGFALSIVWALAAGICTRESDVSAAENSANFDYKLCAYNKANDHDPDLITCDQERAKIIEDWMKVSVGRVAFMALAPIPFAWLGIFILVYAGRIQIVGFRTVVPWATFRWPKKVFVLGCGIFAIAAVFVATTTVSDLVVDARVPVSLGALGPYVNTVGDFVDVQGTWTRSGSEGLGSNLGYPLQTSKIWCSKQEQRCTEARAAIIAGINAMTADVIDYQIESWTPAAIVLRKDSLCISEIFTIDLNTKSVSGAGQRTNKESEFCKPGGGTEERWKYQLVNGFDIYWEQRQKARPLLLRVIQSFFGN